MNHRNLAKLHNATGDAYSSLMHNLEAITLEKRFQSDVKPDTSIYRSAAVQIIAKGGSRDEAHRLMDEARAIEHKKVDLPTSNRTIRSRSAMAIACRTSRGNFRTSSIKSALTTTT